MSLCKLWSVYEGFSDDPLSLQPRAPPGPREVRNWRPICCELELGCGEMQRHLLFAGDLSDAWFVKGLLIAA